MKTINDSHRALYAKPDDWQRYTKPTVLRRQGRDFLRRLWQAEHNSQVPASHALSQSELFVLVESYGGGCVFSSEQPMLVFTDEYWAKRCLHLLVKRGVYGYQKGCHIQLSEFRS